MTITIPVVFHQIAPAQAEGELPGELHYDARDPYAVGVAFRIDGVEWAEWIFARDLLAEGCHAPVGDGDVRVRPHRDGSILVELDSPDGYAAFSVGIDDVADFVRATYDAVPLGAEAALLDLDAILTRLLHTTGR